MKSIIGARIRARRRSLGITQSELAKRVEISPSYLNLIEHNKRQIGGALLNRVATELEFGIDELDGAAERRLLYNLEEIAHLPNIAILDIESDRASEFLGRYPGWARAVSALERSSRENAELARSLTDRLTHDAFLAESVHKMLTAISVVRSAGEILNDFQDIQANERAQFHAMLVDESRNLTRLGEALANYLNKSEFTEKVLTPLDEVEAFLESRENHIEEIEIVAEQLSQSLRNVHHGLRMEKAKHFVETELDITIQQILENEVRLETEYAVENARQTLRDYALDAILIPMAEFIEKANALGYDIESLAETYSTGIESICHRLSAMPKIQDRPVFGYMIANAAGTLVKTRNIPGLISPRYGFACPLWALYRAQQSPEAVLRQRVNFPDGNQFVFLARARLQGSTGFGKPRHYLTDMLALSEESARFTVYNPDPGVPVERVGSTCRSCPRHQCEYRVSDPLST